MRRIGSGIPICVEVTILDGLVLAKSSFESSMNYRSAVVFGKGKIVEGEEKSSFLISLTDKLAPGRSKEVRESTKKELAATLLVSIPLTETSIKVRIGPPKEAEEDLNSPVWSGVVPFKLIAQEPIEGDEISKTLEKPSSVAEIIKNYSWDLTLHNSGIVGLNKVVIKYCAPLDPPVPIFVPIVRSTIFTCR